MRKSSFGLAMIIAVLLTMVVPAIAADLHEPHQGQDIEYWAGEECKSDEIGLWHFVANQHKSDDGRLVLTIGAETIVVEPSKVTKGSMHWWVEGPVSLEGIDVQSQTVGGADLPGKLVVSDAYCIKKD